MAQQRKKASFEDILPIMLTCPQLVDGSSKKNMRGISTTTRTAVNASIQTLKERGSRRSFDDITSLASFKFIHQLVSLEIGVQSRACAAFATLSSALPMLEKLVLHLAAIYEIDESLDFKELASTTWPRLRHAEVHVGLCQAFCRARLPALEELWVVGSLRGFSYGVHRRAADITPIANLNNLWVLGLTLNNLAGFADGRAIGALGRLECLELQFMREEMVSNACWTKFMEGLSQCSLPNLVSFQCVRYGLLKNDYKAIAESE